MQSSERVRQEEALRRGVLNGDELAWRTLYESAYAELWAYVVWRCTGLRDSAEEITQETWLVAVRRMGDFDPQRGRFTSWLRGIAAHLLHNHFRTRRHPVQSLGDEDVAEPTRDDDERREQAERIAQALAELPERCEAVLCSKYLELKSIEQIAAECGQTIKAIESLLTRARQAFRVAYKNLAGNDAMVDESKP